VNAELYGSGLDIAFRHGIFADSQKKEESHSGKIGRGPDEGRVGRLVVSRGPLDGGHWDRQLGLWGRVLVFIGLQ
jgi:hypothetical protein